MTNQLIANHEAEDAIIGALFQMPGSLGELDLVAEDFWNQRNGMIFDTMFTMMTTGQTSFDVLLVAEELKKAGKLGEIGGEAHLHSLEAIPDGLFQLEEYAAIVKNLSNNRKLLNLSQRIATEAYKGTDSSEIIDEATKGLYDIFQDDGARDATSMYDVATQIYEDVTTKVKRGFDTGFIALDDWFGGFVPGQFVVVAGRTGMGKTKLLLDFAYQIANRMKHQNEHSPGDLPKLVPFFSMEMMAAELGTRLAAAVANVDSRKIRKGSLTANEQAKMIAALGPVSELPLVVDDTTTLTPAKLRNKIMKLQMEYKLEIVIVDYIQLMSGDGKRYSNRQEEISYITRMLKGIAGELGVTIIAAAQLSRAPEQRSDKRPMLSDLRESGSIENDANVVMFVYRDSYYEDIVTQPNGKETAEIIIGKFRGGPTGTIHMQYHPIVGFDDIDENKVKSIG